MKIREIKEILRRKFGEKVSFNIADEDAVVETLLTDSRNYFDPEGTLFFAINTPGGNDGHRFIEQLYGKGVRNFIVEYLPDSDFKDGNFLIVPNTLDALTEIGQSHRDRAKEVVAITGSRGKTTLKEIIFQLIEPYKKVSRSPRSFNSKIGVPLSLWQISEDSDLALIEAGISKKGEMQAHVSSINPDTVIFTNIGEAHSHGFPSKEEKAAEKCLLAKRERVKTVIYPLDDEFLDRELSKLGKEKELIRWSEENPEAELFLNPTDDGINYIWKGKEGYLYVKIEREYDLANIAGALAFLLKENIPEYIIRERFRGLKRINTRLNVSEGINGCSIILDSYTSDLSSLLPAIDFMGRRKMPFQSQTLIISDLHHEGGNNEDLYREMADIVRGAKISKFIGIGKTLQQNADAFPAGSKFYRDKVSFLREMSVSDFNDEIILLKGGPEFNFRGIYQQLEAKKHETVLEVNLDALLRNYNYFRSHIPSSTGVVAMVKASGYGAGSYEIAKTLQDAGASYLAVAVLDEGIDLRKNGIIMPIMVMNPRSASYRVLFNNRLEPVIYSMQMLQTLIEEAEKYEVGEYPVHIKLDTGMHRMGFEKGEIPVLTELLSKARNVKVASIFSHLATADCLDMDEYTFLQIERFEEMSTQIIRELGYDVKRHILNSAGILRFPQYHYDLVRLGIGLYGANTLPPEIEKPLAPVSTLRSVIISLREIEGDEAVGYSRKGTVSRKTKVATIPIGYADGMNRKFGNGSINVMVNGKKAPTIGNICMDATMIDVTEIECKEGDSVEIFGENMSVQALADTLETIPYEILTSVSPRVKRVYYRE